MVVVTDGQLSLSLDQFPIHNLAWPGHQDLVCHVLLLMPDTQDGISSWKKEEMKKGDGKHVPPFGKGKSDGGRLRWPKEKRMDRNLKLGSNSSNGRKRGNGPW